MPITVPDPAATLIGFVNTLYLPDGVDVLVGSGPDGWLAAGRSDDVPVAAEAQRAPDPRLEDLRVLREGVRTLLEGGRTLLEGGPGAPPGPVPTTTEVAAAVVRQVPLVVDLAAWPGPGLLRPARPAAGAFEEQVAAVAAALLSCAADGSLARIKVCARPDCRWAYFDTSNNRSRRWCSMASCGNVINNRDYRARQAAR